MSALQFRILLADDDFDDCNFFKKAIKQLPISVQLNIVNDGVELMNYLRINEADLPEVLFLDISMPSKNGIECLTEIKENKKLIQLPVIMFSTSFTSGVVYELSLINTLLKLGAVDFIRKPGDFNLLKCAIENSLKKVQNYKILQKQIITD